MRIEALRTKIKRWASELTDGTLLSGHPLVEPLDLERDFVDVDRLVSLEQWPFTRADLEVSHAQPGAASMVARKNGEFAGFFTAHTFDRIGYLDMMIMDPKFRGSSVARPLYFKTVHALARAGAESFVVHTTNDSARIIGLLGFRASEINFTLLVRTAATSSDANLSSDLTLSNDLNLPNGMMVRLLSAEKDLGEIIRLDAVAFGLRRELWVDALFRLGEARFVGLFKQDKLRAVACLRPRRGGARCLDVCAAKNLEDLAELVAQLVVKHSDVQLECFVRTNSFLHGALVTLGFQVPEFFRAIGPLVEWHKGRSLAAEIGSKAQCLMWL